jgi:hypothetical protein
MGVCKMSNVRNVKIGTKQLVDANCDNCGKRFEYLRKVEYVSEMIRRSSLEFLFLNQIEEAGLSLPESEYCFHTRRRWRLDFAWIKHKVAVEIEGGVWMRGRHVRGEGFIKDCEKYNAAAELGWRLFRYTAEPIHDLTAIKQIKRVLNQQ